MATTTNLALTKGRSKSKLGADFDAAVTAIDTVLAGLAATSNGAKLEIKKVSELITIAAAATSTSVAQLLPANALILGVVGRVTVAIPTATSFTVGDGTTAAKFGTGIAVAAGTTFKSGFAHFNTANTNAAGPVQGSAANIVITPAGGTPAAATGRVRVTVFYVEETAPTS
jgi:hypothetical protein